MKTNIVKKFKLYKGYSGEGGTSGCRIVTGKRLGTECGFGAILDTIMGTGPVRHAKVCYMLGAKPNSFHDTFAWARANRLLTYDPKARLWDITPKGERVLAAIVKNEDWPR